MNTCVYNDQHFTLAIIIAVYGFLSLSPAVCRFALKTSRPRDNSENRMAVNSFHNPCHDLRFQMPSGHMLRQCID